MHKKDILGLLKEAGVLNNALLKALPGALVGGNIARNVVEQPSLTDMGIGAAFGGVGSNLALSKLQQVMKNAGLEGAGNAKLISLLALGGISALVAMRNYREGERLKRLERAGMIASLQEKLRQARMPVLDNPELGYGPLTRGRT